MKSIFFLQGMKHASTTHRPNQTHVGLVQLVFKHVMGFSTQQAQIGLEKEKPSNKSHAPPPPPLLLVDNTTILEIYTFTKDY